MGRCRWLKDRCFTSSCASACTRAFLVVINFVFLASGWALLGLGVWLHICKDTYFFAVLLRDNPTNPMIVLDRVSLIMIAIGGFVIIISFLGCCGACTDSVCFLGFYAFLLVAAIVVQVSVATVAPAFRQKVLLDLSRSMRYQVHYEYNATAKYTNFTNTELYRITSSWDILQIKLNCCGSNGPVDYKEGAWWNHTDFAAAQFVPQSCCTIFPAESRRMKFKDPNMCQVEAIKAMSDYPNITGDFTNVNTQGCHAALVDWLKQYEYLVGVFYIVIILQMVDFIYACILMSWLRKSLTDYSWCEEDEFQ